MISPRFPRSSLLSIAVAALLATGVSTTGTSQGEPLTVHMDNSSKGTNSAGFSISSAPQPGGYTIASVSKGNVEVRVSAPTGSTLSLSDTAYKYYTHSMKISSQYDSLWSALDCTYIDTTYMEAVSPLTNWVDWDPFQKINRSGCGPVTVSASAFGLSISTTNEACTASISPRLGKQKFGVIWNGLSSYWRGAHGVGIVQVPPGKDTQRYIATHMHWRLK